VWSFLAPVVGPEFLPHLVGLEVIAVVELLDAREVERLVAAGIGCVGGFHGLTSGRRPAAGWRPAGGERDVS
jgi:hypothetical protein